MALLGGASSGDSDFDRFAAVAEALKDPNFSTKIAQLKAAEASAKVAQDAAIKAQNSALDTQSKMIAERATLDAKAAENTKIAEANTARTKQLDAAQSALTTATAAFATEKAALTKSVADERAILDGAVKALDVRLGNAEAALADRASRLKASEDALSAARSQYDIDKSELDKRAAILSAAAKAVA